MPRSGGRTVTRMMIKNNMYLAVYIVVAVFAQLGIHILVRF